MCCSRRHATTEGLEDKGEEIAWDEDFWVEGRLEARVVSAKCEDDSREAEVEAGSIESGSNREADDLEEESVLIERIAMRHDSANISNNFEY